MKGSAKGHIGGTLATMMAILRSIPAHIRPRMLEKDMSLDGECTPDPASTVRTIAKIPVL